MEKQLLVRKVFLFSQGQLDMVSRIQQKHSMSNFVEALRHCVVMTHAKEFPDYIQVQKERNAIDPQTKMKMKAKAKQDETEEREQLKAQKVLDFQTNICNLVDGEMTVDDRGIPACRYTMYSMSSPWIINEREVFEQLDNLNKETPSLQYRGLFNEQGEEGKKAIEAARKKIAEKLGAGTT